MTSPFDQFLTALRTADEQATKGPWAWQPTSSDAFSLLIRGNDNAARWSRSTQLNTNDAHAIALVRNSLSQTIAIMEVARRALARISNPLAALQNDALEAGNKLNGPMALQIASDPEYLKSLATAALASIDALAAKTP